MNKFKILGFSPYAYHGNIKPFDAVFKAGRDVLNNSWDGVDAIALWGGTDIDPKYYLEDPHPRTSYNSVSLRDFHEWKLMEEAVKQQIPIIGICRGAQFLCAFAGGRLIQHCTGHNSGQHNITVKTDDGLSTMMVSSAHHQMLYLGDLKEGEDYVLLGWSSDKLSKCYDGKSEDEQLIQEYEPEVVYFPKIKGFAIQGHPEWMHEQSAFVKWCMKEIQKLMPEPEKLTVEAV